MAGKDLKKLIVREVMGKPFPVVERTAPIDRISSLISKDVPAVFVDMGGTFEILTKYDLVQAITPEG